MNTKLPPLKLFNPVKKDKLERVSISRDKIAFLQKIDKTFSIEKRQLLVVEGQSGLTSIDDICGREGITPAIFNQWSLELLENRNQDERNGSERLIHLSTDDKYRIVLEGNNGEFSVAEICRKERIKQEDYLQWSNEFLDIRNKRLQREIEKDQHTCMVRKSIESNSGFDALEYFESFIDVTSLNTKVFNDPNLSFKDMEELEQENIVCLHKINEVRYINKQFEAINSRLPIGGIFMGCLETYSARKARFKIGRIPALGNMYFGAEFIFKRIIPKLSLTKKSYFDITKGKDRVLSKAEGLGRLVSCGFKIIDHKNINGLIYFVVKKFDEPTFDLNPSYGPVYRMPRVGKNGEIIKVYKFRTMHPYSEYLQSYLLKANGYADSGKLAEDYRIPKWGKLMRKYWLDELPQLINVLRGEMKLVGIRPVSQLYFEDIPLEMQKLRLTQKPGCIPPYVSLNRKANVMSVLQAEKDYLEEKIRNPNTTDIKYFFKAIFNILFKSKRSA